MNNYGSLMNRAKSAMNHGNTMPTQLANVLMSFPVGERPKSPTPEVQYDPNVQFVNPLDMFRTPLEPQYQTYDHSLDWMSAGEPSDLMAEPTSGEISSVGLFAEDQLPSELGEHDAALDFGSFVDYVAAEPTPVTDNGNTLSGVDDAMASVEEDASFGPEEDGDLPGSEDDAPPIQSDQSGQSNQEADADCDSIGEDEQGIVPHMTAEAAQLEANSEVTHNEIAPVAAEPESVTRADQLDVQILSINYDIEAEYASLQSNLNQAQEAAANREKALTQWGNDRKAAGKKARKTKKEQAELNQIKGEGDKAVAFVNQLQDTLREWTSSTENDPAKQAFVTQLRARRAYDHAQNSEATFLRNQVQRDADQAAANKEIAELNRLIRTGAVQPPKKQIDVPQIHQGPNRSEEEKAAEQAALFETSRVRIAQQERWNETVGVRDQRIKESHERTAAEATERATWETSLQEAQKALKGAEDAYKVFDGAQRVQQAIKAAEDVKRAEEAKRVEEAKRAAAEEAKRIAAEEAKRAADVEAARLQAIMASSFPAPQPQQMAPSQPSSSITTAASPLSSDQVSMTFPTVPADQASMKFPAVSNNQGSTMTFPTTPNNQGTMHFPSPPNDHVNTGPGQAQAVWPAPMTQQSPSPQQATQQTLQLQDHDIDLTAMNQLTGCASPSNLQLPTNAGHLQYSPSPTITPSLTFGSSVSPRPTQSASPAGPSKKALGKRKASADGGNPAPTPKKAKKSPTNNGPAPVNAASPVIQTAQNTSQTPVLTSGFTQGQNFDQQWMSQAQMQDVHTRNNFQAQQNSFGNQLQNFEAQQSNFQTQPQSAYAQQQNPYTQQNNFQAQQTTAQVQPQNVQAQQQQPGFYNQQQGYQMQQPQGFQMEQQLDFSCFQTEQLNFTEMLEMGDVNMDNKTLQRFYPPQGYQPPQQMGQQTQQDMGPQAQQQTTQLTATPAQPQQLPQQLSPAGPATVANPIHGAIRSGMMKVI